MFGSSNLLKQGDTDVVVDSHSPPKSKSPSTDGTAALEEVKSGAKRNNATSSPGAKSQDEDSPSGDKKRRSSSVSKASSLFASAKNSLHLHHGSNSATGGLSDPHAPQTPMQKLGKIDPALAVAQGPNNNSAGESLPGPRSTFKVGVTEDKNKKCRRTMEDTHSYLYNFLSTPAPIIGPGSSSLSKKSTSGSSTAASDNSTASSKADIIESDNGYFAIFDGHAGNFAAEWCGKKLHLILEDHIRKNPNTPIPELLDQTFTSVDQQLDKLPLKNSGCTAVTAVLRWEDRIPNPQSATGSTAIAPATAAAVKAVNEAHKAEDPSKNASDPSLTSTSSTSSQTKTEAAATAIAPPFQSTLSSAQVKLAESASRQRVLYTANVGDARIVLCRSGKALRLSYDHKGSDENEGRRVANAGGLILNNRVNGVLAVTRALGDAYMKDLVTGHPYTTETVIQPEIDEFLILACDGVSSLFHLIPP